jgi:2,3-bisphosphoglycerate-dependent phosphoglycerate mutase
MTGTLMLVRHGESLWNARHVWTGLTDIGLSKKGEEEAKHVAQLLRGKPITHAFTSKLTRAIQTLNIILDELHISSIPVESHEALNERDYGVFTGKNKFEVKDALGDTAFLALRRSWDYPIEKGESLKQVYERVVPYVTAHIYPLLFQGAHVLVSAHGNSLRALIKHIESISDDDIAQVELKTGEIRTYSVMQGVLQKDAP